MTLLVDHEIAARLAPGHPLATNVSADDYKEAGSQIQAASLDLTIGDIYIPGIDDGKPGGTSSPKNEVTLGQGHTAVIRTNEVLHLDSHLAGIAFPPASVSLKGLLMTNPGHIDPGYQGPLHLTVINMSQVPFPLRRGDRIMRVLFIQLQSQPEVPYDVRQPGPLTTPITSELMGNLSVDFVDVENRAKKIASRAVRRAGIFAGILATIIPVGLAVFALIGNSWLPKTPVERDVQKISERVTVIEAKFGQQTLDGRIKNLEDAIANLKPAAPTKK